MLDVGRNLRCVPLHRNCFRRRCEESSGDEVYFHPDKQQEQRLNSTVKGQEEKVYAEVGGKVSFGATSLNQQQLNVSSIIWKQRNEPVIKAIEWDTEDGVNVPNPRFKDITTLDKETGQITITNLKFEHSGLYTIDINGKEQEKIFKLEVLPPVPKPVIKIEKIEVNPDAVYLICEYSETIIWNNSTGETLQGSPTIRMENLSQLKNKEIQISSTHAHSRMQ
ncbi:uncharacterized protein LOC113100124 [Carassius auratus]|uniref:Uncharacterized protein LOC113100124 n=1 Tax=Carassius auratus TaxID=7957 RepID=A0A6P6PJB4_CARAU|nr:uncharacterized protein LOC113100124 [Carassius auratus]